MAPCTSDRFVFLQDEVNWSLLTTYTEALGMTGRTCHRMAEKAAPYVLNCWVWILWVWEQSNSDYFTPPKEGNQNSQRKSFDINVNAVLYIWKSPFTWWQMNTSLIGNQPLCPFPVLRFRTENHEASEVNPKGPPSMGEPQKYSSCCVL